MNRRAFLRLLLGGIAAIISRIGAEAQLFKERTVGWRRKPDAIISVCESTGPPRLIYALTSYYHPMTNEVVAAELIWNTPAKYDGWPIDKVLQHEGICPYPGRELISADADGWTISTSLRSDYET